MNRTRPTRSLAVAGLLGLSLLGSALAWRALRADGTERVPVFAPSDGAIVWRAEGGLQGWVVPAEAEQWMREAEQAMQVAIAQTSEEPIAVLPFGLEPPPLLGAQLPAAPVSAQVDPPPAPAAEEPAWVDPVPAARQDVLRAEATFAEAGDALAAAQAALPDLTAQLAEAEAGAARDRDKRDKNRRLYEMGAVSRKALERSEALAQASEAGAEAARTRLAEAEVAIATAEQSRAEADSKLAAARAALAEAEATPRPQPTPPAPVEQPPRVPAPPQPVAATQPPAPVPVVVDTSARKLVENGLALARAKLAQAEALQRGIPVSVPAGEMIPLVPSGSTVKSGQRIGWVRVRR